jgi:hypothetical protein
VPDIFKPAAYQIQIMWLQIEVTISFTVWPTIYNTEKQLTYKLWRQREDFIRHKILNHKPDDNLLSCN